MSEIQPRPRTGVARVEEAQTAWDLYIAGRSISAIARELNRDRATVKSLLEEAAVWHDNGDRQQKVAVAVERQRKIIDHAWQQLNSGAVKPTSLAGPQYLLQIREANKEIARLEGLYIQRSESRNVNVTLADLVQEHERRRDAAADTTDIEDLN